MKQANVIHFINFIYLYSFFVIVQLNDLNVISQEQARRPIDAPNFCTHFIYITNQANVFRQFSFSLSGETKNKLPLPTRRCRP